MRLILTFLAVAHARWATAAYSRALYLDRQSARAEDAAGRHKAQALVLLARAGTRA